MLLVLHGLLALQSSKKHCMANSDESTPNTMGCDLPTVTPLTTSNKPQYGSSDHTNQARHIHLAKHPIGYTRT